MSERAVIVIGGGVVGLSCAWHLARDGRPVCVLEQGTLDGSASTGNAGLIAVGHAPMPKPGVVRQGLALMLDPTGPLYVRPRLDPALLRWLRAFSAACRPGRYERSMLALAALGALVRESFEEIIEAGAVDCAYRPVGWLDVFMTDAGGDRARAEAADAGRFGVASEVLDGAALRAREPAFRAEVRGAVHYPDSAFADPRAFTLGLGRAAVEAGARVREHATVAGILVRGGAVRGVRLADGTALEADAVVLAAGAWSTPLARTAGVRIPMQAGKGYHLTVPDPGLRTASVIRETYVACTPIAGRLQLAGTVELAGLDLSINRRRLDMLPIGAARGLRDIDPADARDAWAGLRPCTGDGLPAIGPSRVEGLWVATGHAMMGFCLGPVTGRIIARLVAGEASPVPLGEFDPRRFG